MTLLKLPVGQVGKVIGIKGGWGVQQNLTSLSIAPGRRVKRIAMQPMGGPVMIQVIGGGRIAVGRGMASRVIVRES